MSREGARSPENRAERRSFKTEIAERLDVLRMGPFDVLVLHLPKEVIANPVWMRQAQEGAVEVMEASMRPVVLLPEGTKLTSQDIEPFLLEMGFTPPPKPGAPKIHMPNREIELP